MDSQGLVVDSRPGLSGEKLRFSHSLPSGADEGGSGGEGSDGRLLAAVRLVRPSCLIGAASVGGAFDRNVLQALDEAVQEVYGPGTRPLVLALSNPTSKAECSYEQALEATQVGKTM